MRIMRSRIDLLATGQNSADYTITSTLCTGKTQRSPAKVISEGFPFIFNGLEPSFFGAPPHRLAREARGPRALFGLIEPFQCASIAAGVASFCADAPSASHAIFSNSNHLASAASDTSQAHRGLASRTARNYAICSPAVSGAVSAAGSDAGAVGSCVVSG
jgi:hypothetical protein